MGNSKYDLIEIICIKCLEKRFPTNYFIRKCCSNTLALSDNTEGCLCPWFSHFHRNERKPALVTWTLFCDLYKINLSEHCPRHRFVLELGLFIFRSRAISVFCYTRGETQLTELNIVTLHWYHYKIYKTASKEILNVLSLHLVAFRPIMNR